MRASELIRTLQAAIAESGDHEVVVFDESNSERLGLHVPLVLMDESPEAEAAYLLIVRPD